MYDAALHINTERMTALIEPKSVPLPRRLYIDRLGWNRRSKSETLESSTHLAKLDLGSYRSNQFVPELQQQLIEQKLAVSVVNVFVGDSAYRIPPFLAS